MQVPTRQASLQDLSQAQQLGQKVGVVGRYGPDAIAKEVWGTVDESLPWRLG